MRSGLEFAKSILTGKEIVGVEIGVAKGENALDILNNWKEVVKLYLIDNYAIDRANARAMTENLNPYEKRVELILEKSKKAVKRFHDKTVDFVYVDGDHTYDEVLRDILNWLPKIKDGGVLCGHDYSVFEPGVAEVIGQLKKIGWKIYTDYEDLQNISESLDTKSADWWMRVER